MSVGDVTQLKLIQKALTTTATDSQYANASASYKTTITSITLNNTTASTKRTITVYLYGTAASNAVLTIPLEGSTSTVITELDYVLSSTEVIAIKQDTGTDVNVAVMGITEQIA